ncbi:glycosyltransferase involved in cell wall biosynthesis [Motilibacter rhizosphaerae]|uniref:Glycosyltransferase involved in cell wall biosynthesis n=1 Tax=Motilibacter rhizosphaerae TaxID=598652 RepID=A0A4Q7NSY5_9ACTN|nr:glycosyltransferase involved in cell wall biosynthesis [Motilibacter rhizosphaerae]
MVDVSLVSSGHDVADARLHRLCAALVRAGLAVELRGLGDAADAPPGLVSVVAHPRGSLVRRALDAALLPWRARGRVLLLVDPDPVPSAALARLVRRRRLVVDVHEDYARLLADRSWARGLVGRVAQGVVAAATALARRADVTVVADGHVPPLEARDRRVVRNLPDGGYLPAPAPREERPRALHVGDLRRSRGLFAMVEAVAATDDWTLDLVGPVAAADRDELAGWEDRLGERLRLHGRMPPREAWALAAGAWCGLVLLEDTPAFRDAVPTKLYEFLGCGLAVAATPLPRTAALVEESGAGVLVGSAAELSAALQRWSADPPELDELRGAALRWAQANLYGPSAYDDLAGAIARLAGRGPA